MADAIQAGKREGSRPTRNPTRDDGTSAFAAIQRVSVRAKSLLPIKILSYSIKYRNDLSPDAICSR
jgi:hypothetical protein